MNWVLFVTLGVYMALMLGIGFICRKTTSNVSDYVLGGRAIGGWMTAFSYGTSYFSAVVFIGYAGQFGWNYGVSATWIGLGNALIGSLLAWIVLGERTRRMTKNMNISTMPEFFEKRYLSKGLKTFSALIIFLFLIPYTASVFNGLSTLFDFAVEGVDYSVWVMLMAVFTGIYVVMGGYKATAINDFIQGIIMLGGIIAVVVFALNNKGGLSESLLGLENTADSSGNTGTLNTLFGPDPINLFGVVILTSLGTWGLPQMVHKFYTIKDKPAIKRGAIISTIFAVVVAGGSYFLGGLGRLFCSTEHVDGKAFINTLSNGKPDFDSIVPTILNSAVPDILFGVVIVLVLSASMSTLASLVISSGSTLTVDLIKPLCKKMTEKREVLVMRIFVAVFIVISALIAINKENLNELGINISALMSISWGTLAGSFLAPFLYGLFFKKVTRASVWASLISGVVITVTSMVLFNLNLFPELTVMASKLPLNLASPINWGAIAILFGLVLVPIVNLFTKNKDQKKLDEIMEKCCQEV